ncbi:MAG TPA: 8-oxo-dGTP diphosphatase MutT [Clostridia bacterium]|nr:8-oxo-dGTP diphosphatase MutT [Clostridia bacterium]
MKVIDVAAALVFRAGKLLITQRHPEAHLGGLWEFPGGKREPDETFEACLERELLEELGIEVEVGELLESLTHSYPEKTVHLRFFRCSWRRNEPQALECPAFAWITPEQLGQYTFPAADARLLVRLRSEWEVWAGRSPGIS